MIERVPFGSGALLCPVPPTLVTCRDGEKENVLTVAWAGVINTKPPKVYVSIRPERYSYGMIRNSGELVINLTSADMAAATDFCGVRSGRTVDKFKECRLTPVASQTVSAPTIAESPLSLECRVFDRIPLGSHEMFLLDVLNVTVRKDLIDKNGRLALEKCRLLGYAHGEYRALGDLLGTFGFSVMKKKTAKRRASAKKEQKKK